MKKEEIHATEEMAEISDGTKISDQAWTQTWIGWRKLPLTKSQENSYEVNQGDGIYYISVDHEAMLLPDSRPRYRFFRPRNKLRFLQQMDSIPASLLPVPLETASNPDLVKVIPVFDTSVHDWHPEFPRPDSSIRSSRTLTKIQSHIRNSSSSLHLNHWGGICQIQPNKVI
jgi:hypothetical protein